MDLRHEDVTKDWQMNGYYSYHIVSHLMQLVSGWPIGLFPC